MASIKIQDSLTYLDRVEDDSNGDPSMKDVLHSLNLIISNRTIALENGIHDFLISGTESICVSGPTTVKLELSSLEKVRLIKLEMKNMYSVVSKSSETLTLDGAETVANVVNSLLGILKDILGCEADAIIPVKEQVEALEEKLRFLRNFIWFLHTRGLTTRLFAFAEAVAVNTVWLLYFWLVDKKNDEDMVREVKTGLSNLLEKINPLQTDVLDIYIQALISSSHDAQGPAVIDEYVLGFYDSLVDNLKELSNDKISSMVAEDKEIEILLKELTFLRRGILDSLLLASAGELRDLSICTVKVINYTGAYIFRYADCKRNQGRSSGWNSAFYFLQKYIEDVKRMPFRYIIPKSCHSDFPRTNEVGFIDFLVKDLKERLCCEASSYDILMPQIGTVLKELMTLREDINPIAEFRNKNEELRVLFTSYKDVIYDADYVVDTCLCGSNSLWFRKLELFNLTEEIKNFQEEVKAFIKMMNNETGIHVIAQSLNHVSLQIKPPSIDAVGDIEDLLEYKKDENTNELVGFEDEARKIIEELTRGSEQLKILSIVGMPGLGKTTLANYVYNDPSVTLFFHVRAWCCVSQVYERATLLCGILQQVIEQTIQCQLNADYFAEKLYKSLKGKKYLVVIDDIWAIEAWNDLKDSFPDDNNGSRIVFTTRQRAVALQANSIPHALRMLSNEESWKLLQVKLFKEKICPQELFQVGKRIAENCKGLPLSVVLVAGLLKKKQRNQDSWEDIAKRLRSHEIGNPLKQHYSILEVSYGQLPDYLKPCFLYFGAFPEDTEISVRKLVRLWIAEGFVQLKPETVDHNLETQAENYLNDLIDRSLVTIGKRSSIGRVKACCVHDLLYDFCLDRSKSETFLLRINRHDEYSFLFDNDQYRLSVHSSTIPRVLMIHFPSRVRTLLLSSQENPIISKARNNYWLTEPFSTDESRFPNFLLKFRLLRVLDLSTINITKETEACGLIPLFELVCLRYLAVFAYRNEIPREIGNLQNLETFLLSGPIGEVVLPKTIWNMVSLRHVHITHWPGGFFHLKCYSQEFLVEFSQLDNLTSISNPLLQYGKDVEKLMRKLPNLQKLKCIFSASWDDSSKCNRFPVLDFLNRLESLKISFSGKVLCPCKFSFPSNLKKLTLSLFRLPWDEISVFGRLPNLVALKLLTRAFEGQQWDMKEGEFQKLKFLKLDLIDIALWNASNENLPVLEQLVLHRCKHLEEIPSSFGEIPTLRMIEIKWCKPSAMDSVRQIQEELYHDMGNEQLKVYISHPHRDI